MSTADESLRFTGIFEAELLVELMLRFWQHPLADDRDFRNDLLECAAAVLRASTDGEVLLAEVAPPNMNFVAAVWFAEYSFLTSPTAIVTEEESTSRQNWLDKLRRSIPSCFCNPEFLP